MSAAQGIEELAWDSQQFGIRVGAIDLDLKGAIEVIREACHDFDLVYAKTASEETLEESLLERLGGVLADRRISFDRPVGDEAAPLQKVPGEIRSVGEGDPFAEPLLDLAPQAAAYSRFTADPTFPRAWTEALYRLWMRNSLNRERADDVLAYIEEGEVRGLYTVRVFEGRANLELFAVDEPARGRGIGGALLAAGLAWARERGIERASVTTQEENPACSLYRAFGYTEFARESIYHLWPGGGPADPSTRGR